MSRQTAAHITTIRTAATRAGIDWPEDLETALADAAATLDPPDQQQVAALTYQALRDGRDPATDPEVVAALTRFHLAQAVPHGLLDDMADAARTDAIRDHADGIIDQLKVAVATADGIIEASRRAVPNLDIGNPDQAGSLRPDQAKWWVQARDATLVVEAAASCWKLLATACHLPGTGARHFVACVLADIGADQIDALRVHPIRPRDLIAAGVRLNLASVDELKRRLAAVDQQRERQTTDHESAFADAWRRTHGTGQPIRTAGIG